MYSAELIGVFAAVRGGDATLAFAGAANNSNCFKTAAAATSSSYHNSVSVRFPRASSTLHLCRSSSSSSVDSKSSSSSVSGEVFSVTPSSKSDVDYLGQSTKGDLNVKFEHLEAFGIDGHHATLEGPIEEVARTEAREAEDLLKGLGIPVW